LKHSLFAALAVAGLAGALALLGGAALAAPDISVAVTIEAAQPGANLTAGEPLRCVAVLTNLGNSSAGAFEVDVWAFNASNGTVVERHSLNVTGLAAGESVTLHDNGTFVLPVAGTVWVNAIADPAGRLAEVTTANNHISASVAVAAAPAPPANRIVEDVATRLSATRELPAYSFLALRLQVADGDSVIFTADSRQGERFDCYLMNSENFTLYFDARERPNLTLAVSFLQDYSRTGTDHISYTTEPIAPGTYYLVIENDERLVHGTNPNGSVHVTFAVALVNNSIPPVAVLLVIGAAAAAIWATVRWRPHFDVRSPLLKVPSPDPAEFGEDPDGDNDEPEALPEMDEGEGPPPHPR
jgi:hypothetical protein